MNVCVSAVLFKDIFLSMCFFYVTFVVPWRCAHLPRGKCWLRSPHWLKRASCFRTCALAALPRTGQPPGTAPSQHPALRPPIPFACQFIYRNMNVLNFYILFFFYFSFKYTFFFLIHIFESLDLEMYLRFHLLLRDTNKYSNTYVAWSMKYIY